MKNVYLAASCTIIEMAAQEETVNESCWKSIYTTLKHLTNAAVINHGMEIEVTINGKTIIRSLEEGEKTLLL